MKAVIYGLLAAVVALSVAVAFQFREIDKQRAAGRTNTCASIARVDNNLIALIRDGEKAAARLAYYKQHPADLAQVRAQDAHAIRVLTPPDYC